MQDKCIFLSKFIVQRDTGIRAGGAVCQGRYVPNCCAKDRSLLNLALMEEFVIENGRGHAVNIRCFLHLFRADNPSLAQYAAVLLS